MKKIKIIDMKYIKIITTVLLSILIAFWLFWSDYKIRHLRTNFIITTGHITGITGASFKNNNRSVLYDYLVNGKTLHGENNLSPCVTMNSQELLQLLANTKFAVAYDFDDTSKSEIILREREAKIYKFHLPQSLKFIDSLLSCK
jgi:hypothetical protein